MTGVHDREMPVTQSSQKVILSRLITGDDGGRRDREIAKIRIFKLKLLSTFSR